VLSDLWIAEAVVTGAALETRIAWCGAVSDTLKERLKGAVDTEYDILQNLDVDLAVLGHGLFDAGQLGLLLVGGDRGVTPLSRFATLADGSVIDMATQAQHPLKFTLVLW
jgi:hypothetical protein